MSQELGSLLGFWRCRNDQFALVSKQTTNGFSGHIFVEYKKDELSRPELVPLLTRAWTNEGNCVGAGREYDLIERKRGEEKGWPQVKTIS